MNEETTCKIVLEHVELRPVVVISFNASHFLPLLLDSFQ